MIQQNHSPLISLSLILALSWPILNFAGGQIEVSRIHRSCVRLCILIVDWGVSCRCWSQNLSGLSLVDTCTLRFRHPFRFLTRFISWLITVLCLAGHRIQSAGGLMPYLLTNLQTVQYQYLFQIFTGNMKSIILLKHTEIMIKETFRHIFPAQNCLRIECASAGAVVDASSHP